MKAYYMKNKRNIFTILFTIFLTSTNCTSNSNKQQPLQQVEIVSINPTKVNDPKDFFNLIEDIDFIKLETTHNNPIDWIQKLWITDKSFLVKTGSWEVHAYSHSGRYKYKKDKEGKGKNEIQNVYDFCPGPNESIYILGYKEYYIIDQYGAFVEVKSTPRPYESFNPGYFYIIDDQFQLYSTSTTGTKQNQIEEFSLWLYTNRSDVSKFYLQRKTCNIAKNAFLQNEDKVLITPVIGVDSIYAIISNEVVPAFYIDFGKYKSISSELPDDQTAPFPAFEYATENRKCLSIYAPFMDDNWLTFSYYFHKDYYLTMYNRIDQSYIIIEKNNKNVNTLLFMTSPLAFYRNKLYYSLPAYKIRGLLDDNAIGLNFLPETRRLQLLEKLKDVKETDNPVLMLVTFKDQ
ncbi:hypothetical protein MASR1M74_00050 [Lentimicrobium sp.]